MTVIRPNSISGITSITAQANEINIFRSDGTLAGLQINGINFNNTSGISTLAALNVTGNVSIAGTLTYEDVTNVDSVGIITARSTIDAQGSINLADSIIHTGDTDTKIQFGTDTINFNTAGGERVHIASDGDVGIGTVNPNAPLDVFSNTTATNKDLFMVRSITGAFAVQCSDGAAANPEWRLRTYSNEPIVFSPGNNERLRITSDGKVGINSSAPNTRLDVISSSPVSRTWTPGSSVLSMFERNGHCRIALISSATSYSEIDFADANDDNSGYIRYDNSDNSMSFRTNGSGEALTVDAFGRVLIGGTSAIIGSSSEFNEIVLTGKTRGAGITLQDVDANTRFQIRTDDNGDGTLLNASTNDPLVIRTNNTERLRISSTGAVTIPAQPCVQLHTVSNIGSLGSSFNNTPFQFSGVHINQGGMTLSNSNSRVQVPVSGIYLVTAMASGGNYSTADAGDGVRFKLRRNGSDYPDTNAYPISTLGSTNDQEYYFSFSILVDLTASDYLELMFDNISTSFGGSITRGQLGVHLVS